MVNTSDPSALLGDYLLRGWAMLGDVCPNPGCQIPLMRSKDRSQTICVVCINGSTDINATAEEKEKEETISPHVAPSEDPTSTTTTEKRVDPSAILGQYLMTGWAMMNDSCANCYSPLMRSQDKSMIKCVVCEHEDKHQEKKSGSQVEKDNKVPFESQRDPSGVSIEDVEQTPLNAQKHSFIDQCIESTEATITQCCSLMKEHARNGKPNEMSQYMNAVFDCLKLLDELKRHKN